ncbi:MAG TPA: hypothetical protein VIK96_00840 [Bacilli bacterium]|jgi:hypothetical protein
MTDYYRIPSLENVYLEDSFLLDVEETNRNIIMRVEIVLTENHALYEKPLPDEAYCYRNAKLTFSDFEKSVCLEKKFVPFTDASGEVDYGNIDFLHLSNGVFEIGGDCGHLRIFGGKVALDF